MNRPPETSARVSHASLHEFVSSACRAVGMPEDKAELLARLLSDNDLRGVFSHGTRQICSYARLMRDGKLNSNPKLEVVKESPVSVLVDGDGGLGYFPAHEGTQRAIRKAKDQGMAVMMTRNHGHFGAAGLYSRMTLEHDLVAFVTSGHQLDLKPGQSIYSAAGGSPMSFSAPTLEEDPVVLDFGTMHDLYAWGEGAEERRNRLVELAPGMVLRCIGQGVICQSWGGMLAGIPFDAAGAQRVFEGANQGSMLIAMRIDLFADPEDFKRNMDAYVRAVHQLAPLPGFDRSLMPGGPEAERERAYREEGVPFGDRHREQMEALAEELGIGVPW